MNLKLDLKKETEGYAQYRGRETRTDCRERDGDTECRDKGEVRERDRGVKRERERESIKYYIEAPSWRPSLVQ